MIFESNYNGGGWYNWKAYDFYCPGNEYYFDNYEQVDECRIEYCLVLYLHVLFISIYFIQLILLSFTYFIISGGFNMKIRMATECQRDS